MSKVEDVARAICQAQGCCKYAGGRCNTGRCTVTPAVARAAIEAMREPTEAMLDALHDASLIECDPGARTVSILNERELWSAIIDAALDEPDV